MNRQKPNFAIPCALAILALIVPLLFGNAEEQIAPKISIEPTALDFGEVLPDARPESYLVIKNVGNAILTVSNIRASCFCTNVDLDAFELKPGQSRDLAVSLNLEEYGVNEIHSRVYFETNDPTLPQAQIDISGTVRPEYTASADAIEFGKVKAGSVPTASIAIDGTGQVPVTVLRIESPPELAATVAAVDENGDAKKAKYDVQLTLSKSVMPGPFHARITVVTDVKRYPKLEIPVHAEVVGVECQVEPKVLTFGSIKPGASIGSIKVTGERGIKILSATSKQKDLEFSGEVSTIAKQHQLNVSIPADADPGKKAGNITLTIQEGDLVETRDVPFFGTVIAP